MCQILLQKNVTEIDPNEEHIFDPKVAHDFHKFKISPVTLGTRRLIDYQRLLKVQYFLHSQTFFRFIIFFYMSFVHVVCACKI